MNYMHLGIITDIMNTLRDMLQGWVLSNLQDMLTTMNEKVGQVATELSTDPTAWQGGKVFTLIVNIAEQVALPIAGIIFTFVIIWELISMLTMSNTLGDVDIVSVIIKWLLKTVVAAWFIANSLTICNCFFGIGADMVSKTNVVFNEQVATVTNDSGKAIQDFFNENFNSETDATGDELGQLLSLGILTVILNLVMKAMSICITIVLYSRMITIYMHCAVAPIPIATVTNQHMQQTGMNFLKSVFALAVQGFLMMICVAIYGALLANVLDPSSVKLDLEKNPVQHIEVLNECVLQCVGLSILLVYTMFQTATITKTIFCIQ